MSLSEPLIWLREPLLMSLSEPAIMLLFEPEPIVLLFPLEMVLLLPLLIAFPFPLEITLFLPLPTELLPLTVSAFTANAKKTMAHRNNRIMRFNLPTKNLIHTLPLLLLLLLRLRGDIPTKQQSEKCGEAAYFSNKNSSNSNKHRPSKLSLNQPPFVLFATKNTACTPVTHFTAQLYTPLSSPILHTPISAPFL